MNKIARKIKLSGTVSVEASKSILNRVLIIAGFLDSELKIMNTSSCDDIKTMIRNVKKLEIKVRKKDNFYQIIPKIRKTNNLVLNPRNSATAFRFLLAKSATLPNSETKIILSSQMRKRPHKRFYEILKKLGAEILEFDSFIIVKGTNLNGGRVIIPANISSQFISALLLIAPVYKQDLILELEGEIVSKKYIELTLKIMKDFGVETRFMQNQILVHSGQKYENPGIYRIEPDYSSAAYFWALGSVSENFICTKEIFPKTVQADFRFRKILQQMGAEIKISNDKICIKSKKLKGIEIDMKDMPDQVPTLAVLALLAESQTIIKNISHLRYKESDRINALIAEIRKIGGKIEYSDNNLVIYPLENPPRKVIINSHDDHRITMSFQILKEMFPYLEINGKKAVEKSFPDFFVKLNQLRKSSDSIY